MLHLVVEGAFDHLLTTWRAHEHNRDAAVEVTVLAESRRALDQARTVMHKLRTAIHPDATELESVIESVWCESLDAVVHLRLLDRDPVRPGNFTCPCGHLTPIDWEQVSSSGSAAG